MSLWQDGWVMCTCSCLTSLLLSSSVWSLLVETGVMNEVSVCGMLTPEEHA